MRKLSGGYSIENTKLTSYVVTIINAKKCHPNPNLGGGFKYFFFHPYLGKIPILTNIFQMGWNHQLEIVDTFVGPLWWSNIAMEMEILLLSIGPYISSTNGRFSIKR